MQGLPTEGAPGQQPPAGARYPLPGVGIYPEVIAGPAGSIVMEQRSMEPAAASMLSNTVRRGAGLGALVAGTTLAACEAFGASPRVIGVVVGAQFIGLSVGAALPSGGARWLRITIAIVLGAGAAAGLGDAARLLGGVFGAPGAVNPLLFGALTLTIAFGGIGSSSRGMPSLQPLALASAAAGAAGALLVDPLIGASFGAAALTGPQNVRPRTSPGVPWLLFPLGIQAVLVLSAVQPASTPAPGGAIAFGLGSLACAAFIGIWTHRASATTVLGLVSVCLAPVVVLWTPDVIDALGPWVLGARPARGRVLLLLPLVCAGAVLGPALGSLGALRGAPWLLGAGLIAGALSPSVEITTWVAVATALAVVLGTSPPIPRFVAALCGIGLVVGDWQGIRPSPESLVTGLHRTVRSGEAWDRERAMKATMTAVDTEAGPQGAVIVRAPVAWAETAGQRGRPDRWNHHVEQQGTVSTSTGREAEAERLAGHLAALLAPERPRAVILGDPGGRALAALLVHPVDSVDVSVPVPTVTRSVAMLDPAAREAWLSSRVRLRDIHPDSLLRTTSESDLVLEILRSPWRDAVHAAPDPAHLDAVRSAVGAEGTYVLAVHLSWFDQGTVAAVAREVSERFGHTQLWLPTSGADTLFIVGSPRPPSLRTFEFRFVEAAADMRELGIPSAEVLAGFAVGDGITAGAWEPAGRLPRTDRLPDAVLRKPVLHLGSVAWHLATPPRLWTLDGALMSTEALADRIAGRRTFLELLSDASTGDLQGVFAAAQALVAREGDVATQALETLIEPQMMQARDALRRAIVEGPSSRFWADAQRNATTARMLSPRSVAPPLLLGEVALAQGNLNSSREFFAAAAALAPENTAARTGLARVAIARRDFAGAEAHLREAVQLAPQDWQAWSNLGRHLTETGSTVEAEEVLRRAATMAGDESVEPHLRLAELYLTTERPTTALVHAERAVLMEGSAESFYLRGRGYFAVDELDQAEDDFRRAVLTDSRHARARGAIGHVRALRGDLKAAVESFRQVVVMDPTNAAARENLDRAEALLRQQEFQGTGQPTGDGLPTNLPR